MPGRACPARTGAASRLAGSPIEPRPSPPAKRGRDVGQDRLDHVRVIGHAQLIWHREQQRVRLGDRLILPELLDEGIRFGGVAAPKDRARLLVDEADLIALSPAASEIGAILVADEREDAATDGDSRLP